MSATRERLLGLRQLLPLRGRTADERQEICREDSL